MSRSLAVRPVIVALVTITLLALSLIGVTTPASAATAAEVEFQLASSDATEAGGGHVVDVVLRGDAVEAFTVDVVVAGGDASNPADHTFATTTVSFDGTELDGATKSVTVPVVSDTDVEGIETLVLGLSNFTNGAAAADQSTHRIYLIDDDGEAISFRRVGSSVSEAGPTIDVELIYTGAANLSVGSDVDVTDALTGSAASPTDYTFTSPTTVNFLAGDVPGTVRTATVTIAEDAIHEPTKTVDLGAAVVTGPAATGALAAHTVSITDNDPATVQFVDPTSTSSEGAGSHGVAVQLTTPGGTNLASTVTVDITDALSGSATNGSDYSYSTTTVTFPATTTSGSTMSVFPNILDDNVREATETIDLAVDGGSVTGPATASGTLAHTVSFDDLDDVGVVTISTPSSITEGGGLYGFTINLDKQSDFDVTVEYSTSPLGAEAGSDYTTVTGGIATIPMGSTSTVVNITVADDGIDEITEDFTVSLANPASATDPTGTPTIGSPSSATGVIIDNDNLPPTIDSLTAPTGAEGASITVTGSWSDPGVDDPHTITVSWGDGSPVENFGTQTSPLGVSHTFADNGIYHISFCAQDEELATDCDTTVVAVSNVAPVVDATPDSQNSNEDDAVSIDVTFTDAGSGDTHTATVDWGDGSPLDSFDPATSPFTATHTYTSTGSRTVQACVTDDDTSTTCDSVTINVNNAAPVVTAGTHAGNEGSATVVNASFTDVDDDNAHSAMIDWGDGSPTEAMSVDQGANTLSAGHTYADNGSYTISITVTDGGGADGTGSGTVNVANVDPVASIVAPPATADEGDLISLDGAGTDVGTVDAGSLTFAWDVKKDGVGYATGSTEDFSFTPDDDATYDVTLTVTDKDGGTHSAVASIAVANVDPTGAVVGAPASADEGDSITVTASSADAGSADLPDHLYSWVAKLGATTFDTGSGSSFTFIPPDEGTVTVELTIDDQDGGTVLVTDSFPVANVPSSMNFASLTTIDEGDDIGISGTWTDPGPTDTFSATVDYGEGADAIPLTLNPDHTFDLSNIYEENGTYNVITCITDNTGEGGCDVGTVIVNNVDPSLSGVAATDVNENGSTTLTGTIVDPGSVDPLTLTVDWGDGSDPEVFTYAAGTTSFSETHTYLDDDPTGTSSDTFTVSLTIADDDGGSGTASTTLTVSNVAPTLALSATDVNENGATTLSGTITDPGTLDSFSVTVTWGDGNTDTYTYPAGTTSFSEAHVYLDDDPTGTASDLYTIGATITDDDTGTGSASTTLTVSNVAPTLALSATDVNENGSTTLSGTITDPGTLDSFSVTVTWGDGNTDTYTYPAGTTSFSETHQYLDDDPTGTASDLYTIGATITDDDTGSGSTSTTLTVSNVDPVLSGLSASDVAENGISTATGTITDPGTLDSFTLVIDWGDGNSDTYTYPAGTTSFSETHQYLDDDPSGTASDVYTVNFTVTDDDTGSGIGSTTLTVSNVAPVLSGVAATDVDENSATTLTGSITDPGTKDTFTLTVDWGDGNTDTYSYPAGTTSFSETHVYLDDDPTGTASDVYTISVGIVDDDTGSGAASTSLTVSNVAPAITASATDVDENSATTLTGSITDPGTLDTFTVTVDWGDGNSDIYTYPAGTTSYSETHVYLDDNPTGTASDLYTISVGIVDDDTGSGSTSTTLTVSNVAPVLSGLAASDVDENGVSTLTGTITDPGTLDSFSVVVDWADGSVDTYTYPAGTTSFSETHQYLDDDPTGTPADMWIITVGITDDDTGTDFELVPAITISNVDPAITASATDVDENSATTLSGTITDPGTLDTFTVTVDWGDGNSDTYTYPAGTTSYSETHVYLDDAPTGTASDLYTISVGIVDDDTGSGAASTTLTVSNVAPSITAAATDVDENSATTLSGTITDPGSKDTFTLTVDWGDGNSDTYTYPAGTTSYSETHVYLDDDPTGTSSDVYTISVGIVDDDTGSGAASTTLTVSNVDPIITASATDVDENSATTLSGSITDPGTLDSFTVTVDWGDGNTDTYSYPAGTTSYSETHVYLDDDPTGTASDVYTINVGVVDDDTGSGVASTTLTVSNVDPAIAASATDVDENGSTTLSGTITDPGSKDTFGVTVDWGDGTTDTYSYAAGTTSFAETHVYIDEDPSGTASDSYTISLEITDDDTGSGATSTTLTVSNVDPTITAAATDVDENGATTLSGSITDPGLLDTFTVTVDWGDGTTDTYSYPAGTTSYNEMHIYLDDDPTGTASDLYTISVDVVDDDTGSGAASTSLTVSNVAPSLLAASATDVDENGTATLSLEWVDDSSLDTFTVTVDWGDGTTDTYTYGAGVTEVTETHQYLDDDPTGTSSDLYTITIDIVDDDGGADSTFTTLTVSNVDPMASIDGLPTGDVSEGDLVELSAVFSDVGTLDTHDVFWSVNKDLVSYDSGTGSEFSFTPDDDATYDVTLIVQDDDGGSVSVTETIVALNADPVPALSGLPETGDEGDTFTGTASATDAAGAEDTLTFTWAVTKDEAGYATGSGTGIEFTADDEGTYVVTVTVTDEDGGSADVSHTVVVANVAPSGAISGLPEGPAEGDTVNLSVFKPADPGPLDVLTFTWSITLGEDVVASGDGSEFTFDIGDDGEHTVTLTIADDDGATTIVTGSFLSTNVAPSLDVLEASTPDLSGNTTVTVGATDAGSADRHTVTIDWGDGTVDTLSDVDFGTFETIGAGHDYDVHGTFVIEVCVDDGDGGSDCGSASVTVIEFTHRLSGDFTGNGNTDLAVFAPASGTWHVGASGGAGFEFSPWETGVPVGSELLVADFNGDGKDDIAGFVEEGAKWYVSVSNGTGFTTSQWADFASNNGWTKHVVGDFNNDGKADIANYHLATGRWYVAGSNGTKFVTTLWASFVSKTGWDHEVSGDFDGDGDVDLAIYHRSTGRWYVAKSGGGVFTTSLWATTVTNANWAEVFAADFTGDGNDDIAVFDSTTRTWSVAVSDGSGFTITNWVSYVSPSGWNTHVVGDFNADGRADVASFHGITARWYVGQSSGTGFTSLLWANFVSKTGWTEFVAGDFNNDGRTDVANYHSGTRRWYVSRSLGMTFDTKLWGMQ